MTASTKKSVRPPQKRKSIGLGFVPAEARHGFLLSIPKGTGKADMVTISEHRGNELLNLEDRTCDDSNPGNPALRVVIDRRRWLELAPGFWSEARRRLSGYGLTAPKYVKNPAKSIPIHSSLGKELCILCWAVEESSPDDIPNALLNWENLAPEERWWLYTMTVATTGQAMQKGIGWRKALRAALADNPFVKGEGSSPKARRQLLGHPQLEMDF